jgi:mRNA-degrading endonuclease toxin of MazEF toxin-antitoxin module
VAVAEQRSIRTYVLIAAGTLAVIVAVLVVLARTGSRPLPTEAALNAEQKAYLEQIVITDARMSAAENFLGNTVTYLDAEVTNKGSHEVRQLELEIVFVDTLSQVVLRYTARPITLRSNPLRPGQTRSFQVSFEHMPVDWNQALPTITPKSVQF